ncbi:ATP-grasp domain-containing protein [Asticcacaulis sp. YBE204]|uniref:ATP-grasp domain-containing protein n=1 Tax=Asticcacaulis sp. YBE204 TaxID=1282363 RepID=UPI0003C3C448|nr:ATP-grasp domain-containing protein [Asticcacaulis sp. YBE204]ESQ78359.1 hypothetical protein AEYBE204_14400 [Asticcacaulis sp. YBE204]
MSRVLVTGVRAPVAVDLIRALISQGHEVHAADVCHSAVVDCLPVSSFTRYASPVFAPERFRINALAIAEHMDAVICLCEEIFHWAKLEIPLFAADRSLLIKLHSKLDFIRMAGDLGLNIPTTHYLGDARDDMTKAVLKPEFSRFGTRVLIRPDERTVATLPHDPGNPWLIQSHIHGEDLSFYAIARDGRLTAFSAYRSAWRTRGGASYYIDPVEADLSQRVESIARTLIAGLSLTGQIACDLRQDRDGRLWLLECNPRATSGLHLLAHDPAALTAAFIGNGPVVRTDGCPAYVGPAMRAYGWPQAIREGRLRTWRADMSRGRDVLKGLTVPALRDTLGHGLRAMRRRQRLAAGMTADIEYNGGHDEPA